MNNKKDEKIIYIIKLKGEARTWDDFRKYLSKSKNMINNPAYYNLRPTSSPYDMEVFENMEENTDFHCAILDYEDENITCLYWAVCTKYRKNETQSIHCRLKYLSTSKVVIDNFVYCLQLNLDKDFPENSFINYDTSIALIEQMKKLEMDPFIQQTVKMKYSHLDKENGLSPLAQKNEYCCRKYNLKEPQARGEFQRDYDRIVYSKAFRRMVDKSQIFSSAKGDHYRTRMTHTLIVCQIAKSICSELNLNCALAEAIAMGHDLGHTPFGHQGERTLQAILTGETGFEVESLSLIDCDGKGERFPYGGFKHNYQSVRVATSLESQYLEIDGLDLSEQTLNGMWLHTKKKNSLNISDFSDGYISDEGNCAFTLEGQVVAVADEIAQRSHDIDDAFAAHLISLSDFTKYLELKKSSGLKAEIDSIPLKLQELRSQNRLFSNENEVTCAQISSLIVDHFIRDVCTQTQKEIDQYSIEKFEKENHHIQERLVWFSEAGEELCKYLDNIINKKVINSREVTLFDQNGSNIVLALFRKYYKNPMLLHLGTLKRIWNECRKQNLEMIDFWEGKPELIKTEWSKITATKISANSEKQKAEDQDLLRKRKILVRAICDFISGMTDNYALNEYHKMI